MGTWGTGPLMSDSAQDFLDQLKELPSRERISRVEGILARVAEDPAIIMREFVPEEVVAAAAVVGATVINTSAAEWVEDENLRRVVSGMPPQYSMLEIAGTALDAAMSYGDSWLISSWKSENDRRSAVAQLGEIRAALVSD
ncbi:DUF4259 domain-containing protein [Pseudofrankia saprophytica]|nr:MULTISPECIES: DUF4259 domain-containing protein [Pseudofrankia]